jgi:hypothetical protein
MTSRERIEGNYYENGWVAITDPENYDGAEIAALVAAGLLRWDGDVRCIEGHTVWGAAKSPAEAEGERWRGAACERCTDDERSEDPDDCTVAVRYVMSPEWREALDAARPWVACEHCGGEGKIRRFLSRREGP